jgi:hypothetical protein
MSTRHHAPIVQEVNHMLRVLHKMENEDIEYEYGITIYEDGTVFDPAYDRTFATLSDWVQPLRTILQKRRSFVLDTSRNTKTTTNQKTSK